jgi:hypothetical protein
MSELGSSPQFWHVRGMSGTLTADIAQYSRHVRLVPESDITSHLPATRSGGGRSSGNALPI